MSEGFFELAELYFHTILRTCGAVWDQEQPMLAQLLLRELDKMATQEQMAGRELTTEDRCDSCSAAAKVVATFLNGELLFCGHHARDLKDSLLKQAATLYDPEAMLF